MEDDAFTKIHANPMSFFCIWTNVCDVVFSERSTQLSSVSTLGRVGSMHSKRSTPLLTTHFLGPRATYRVEGVPNKSNGPNPTQQAFSLYNAHMIIVRRILVCGTVFVHLKMSCGAQLCRCSREATRCHELSALKLQRTCGISNTPNAIQTSPTRFRLPTMEETIPPSTTSLYPRHTSSQGNVFPRASHEGVPAGCTYRQWMKHLGNLRVSNRVVL